MTVRSSGAVEQEFPGHSARTVAALRGVLSSKRNPGRQSL